MAMKRRFYSEALQYSYDRFIAGHPEDEEFFEQALFDTEVASKVYDLRTKAGLSHGALAKKVGTTASVICSLEDADYEGNSVAMLRRIAEAVGKRLQIRIISATKPKGPRARKVA
jgi:ribosome-binding protein aMBF1 (putative translation factor)